MFISDKEEKPMDPATLAASTLAILSPYLIKAGGAAAEKIGESLPENAQKLWTALSAGLHGNPQGAGALKNLSEDPTNEKSQETFRNLLKETLAKDPEFLDQLIELFENARKESIQQSAVASNNSNAVNVGGNVGGNIVIGNNNAVNHLNKKK